MKKMITLLTVLTFSSFAHALTVTCPCSLGEPTQGYSSRTGGIGVTIAYTIAVNSCAAICKGPDCLQGEEDQIKNPGVVTGDCEIDFQD